MYDLNNLNNQNNGNNNTHNPYSGSGLYQPAPYTFRGDSGYTRPGQAHNNWQYPEQHPETQKKPRSKAPRYIALATALVVMSSAAGGGTAMWVLSQAEASPASGAGTVVQTSTSDKIIPADDGSIAAVAAAAAASVVEIDTQMVQQSIWAGSSLVAGAGSGVIVSEDGYIVTNNHVVEGTESVLVRTMDGTEYKAQLIGTDEQTDLAVLKVEATGLQSVVFADSDQARVGELAVAIGNPLGELGGTVTSGIISATGREISIDDTSMTLLQTSAAVNPGNSGGGLFDASGHLVGLVNAKSSGANIEGLAFAIPSNTVQEVLVQLLDNGYVSGRPRMGISVIEINDARTAAMYGVNKAGVYVADPGDNTGLKEGDRFVFLAGESITTSADVTKALQSHAVGDTITVTVERSGKEVQTQITLVEKVPEGAKITSDPI